VLQPDRLHHRTRSAIGFDHPVIKIATNSSTFRAPDNMT
jgi:hypothetical protein